MPPPQPPSQPPPQPPAHPPPMTTSVPPKHESHPPPLQESQPLVQAGPELANSGPLPLPQAPVTQQPLPMLIDMIANKAAIEFT